VSVLELSRVDIIDETYPLTPLFPGLNLAGATVSVAVLAVGRKPTAATVWFPQTLAAGSVTVRLAGPDADSTGAVAVSATSELWAKVTTADGQVDAAKIGRVNVLGGGQPLAAPLGIPVVSVNGKTGSALSLTATDVGADAAGAAAAATTAGALDAATATNVASGAATSAALRAAFERRPAPLEGTIVRAYGDSFLVDIMNFPTEQGIAPLVASRVGATSLVNGAIGGTTMGQALSGLIDGPGIWTPGTHGLVILKAVVNSVANVDAASDAQEKIGFAEALRSILCILRSSAWVNEDVTTNQTLSAGQWAPVTVPIIRGGSIVKATQNGATVTITTTASEIDLTMLTFPNAATAKFTVTVNGAYHGSGTTQNQGSPSTSYHHMVYRVTGLTGTSTIVLTHADTTGLELYYDGFLTASPQPPGVVVCLDAPPAAAGLQINGATANRTAANLDVYNDLIVGVCSEFDGLVRVADPRPRFNNANDRVADLLHPNAIGAAKYADAIYAQAILLPASEGLLP